MSKLPLQGQWDIRGIKEMRRDGCYRLVEGRAVVIVVPHEDGQCRALGFATVHRRPIDGPRQPLRNVVAVGASTPTPRAAAPAVAVVPTAGNAWVVLADVQTGGILVSPELDLPLVLGGFLEDFSLVVLVTLLAATRLSTFLAAIFAKL